MVEKEDNVFGKDIFGFTPEERDWQESVLKRISEETDMSMETTIRWFVEQYKQVRLKELEERELDAYVQDPEAWKSQKQELAEWNESLSNLTNDSEELP